MERLPSQVRMLLVCLVLCHALSGQVSRSNANTGPALVSNLIGEAEDADSPAGNGRYARQLAELLVPPKIGDTYLNRFSNRLSRADLMARRHERSWIPESVVAKAFNDLMLQVGGRSHHLPRTDANIVHQLRITLSEISSVLSTVNTHNSECLPSEAVQLMVQLLFHNGSIEGPCQLTSEARGAIKQHACADTDAIILIFKYCRSHSASELEKPFDHAALLFGM